MTERPRASHDFSTVYAEEDMGETATVFTRRASLDGHGVVVDGTCPRCQGRTTTEYRHGLPGTGTKGLLTWLRGEHPVTTPDDDSDALTREVHYCECGHPHPNLPPDAAFTGCGASWRIRTLTAERAT